MFFSDAFARDEEIDKIEFKIKEDGDSSLAHASAFFTFNKERKKLHSPFDKEEFAGVVNLWVVKKSSNQVLHWTKA